MPAKRKSPPATSGGEAAEVIESLSRWYLAEGKVDESRALSELGAVLKLRGKQDLSTIRDAFAPNMPENQRQ
jgi:hypothetical protein